MSESDLLARYRSGMMMHALRRIGRTRFHRVLDIGCSDGHVLRAIARKVQAQTAVGLDLNAEEGESGGIVLRKGDLFEYSADTPFDLVVSNQVFEHIYEPWLPKYFSVLKRSCASNGVILLSTPNRWRALNLFRLLTLRRPYMMQANPGVPPAEHLGHHRECSYRELAEILRSAFDEGVWRVTIVRSFPRDEGSRLHWLARCVFYAGLWPLWRPLVLSASQDHYVALERMSAATGRRPAVEQVG